MPRSVPVPSGSSVRARGLEPSSPRRQALLPGPVDLGHLDGWRLSPAVPPSDDQCGERHGTPRQAEPPILVPCKRNRVRRPCAVPRDCWDVEERPAPPRGEPGCPVPHHRATGILRLRVPEIRLAPGHVLEGVLSGARWDGDGRQGDFRKSYNKDSCGKKRTPPLADDEDVFIPRLCV